MLTLKYSGRGDYLSQLSACHAKNIYVHIYQLDIQ